MKLLIKTKKDGVWQNVGIEDVDKSGLEINIQKLAKEGIELVNISPLEKH
jgi:hypothetical protein